MLTRLACALAIAYVVPATAQASPATLTASKAVAAARVAVKDIGNDASAHRPKCKRNTRYRFRCTTSWTDDDGDYRWSLSIVVTRSGPDASPVDRYTITGKGTPGRGRDFRTQRVSGKGRVVVETRRAVLGQELELAGQDDGAVIRVTLHAPIDPLPTGEYTPPPDGSRYVGFPMTLRNVGSGRFDDSLHNGVRLITDRRAVIRPEVIVEGPCIEDSVDIPERDSRLGCVAFLVPYGTIVNEFEYTPDSGYGPETGEWAIPGGLA